MKSKRLAILTTHPIQYHGAWFRRLAAEPRLSIEVFYCHQASAKEQASAGFGVEFDWNIPLLEGYPHRFLRNVARTPAIAGFAGLDTPEIKDTIARERFDAVMINGWHYKSSWQAMHACWKSGTPVMVRSDSHLHSKRSLFKRVAKQPFYSWFISKLDACLPVGKWSSDYFLHYGASPERVVIVPHVVDTDFFDCQSQRLTPQRDALRARWHFNDAIVFLFVGKFTEQKRPLDFLNAIGEAKKLGAPVAGLMVGDGPLRAACEKRISSNNLPVRTVGFLNQSQIAEAYVAADALVLPSTAETWGVVVNEAMACARPCFVSDRVGCAPDMIKADETGVSFPVGDTAALGLALSRFALNRHQISWMGERAREQSQMYTLSVAVDRTIQALETVAG
jgi:glycosyltransferase involved in cell wall biosynthesis